MELEPAKMEVAILSELGAWTVELAGTEAGDTMFYCVVDCLTSVEEWD